MPASAGAHELYPTGPSPEIRGGVLFLTLALSALSLVSGAVADKRGPLPHDGAVDRSCELARNVRLYWPRSLRRFAEVPVITWGLGRRERPLANTNAD